jgi:hypothetical protein
MTVTKEADMRKKADKGPRPATAGEGANLSGRWSAQRKTELVRRLLQGEALDAVSRDSQVPGHELEGCTRVCLEHGARGLKSRLEPEERELTLISCRLFSTTQNSIPSASRLVSSLGRDTE